MTVKEGIPPVLTVSEARQLIILCEPWH